MPTSSTTEQLPDSPDRVSYCINPKCTKRQNSDNLEICQACGSPLLIKNRYRLLFPLRPLTVPGHSEIFEVEDLGVEAAKEERYKVLKVLKKNDETLVRLFKQEADVLTKLNHPGIPKIQLGDGYFTVSVPGKVKSLDLHCLVMDKVEGENLQNWLDKNGFISQEQALQWLYQLLQILDYLHQNYYFHRDIKPTNIMRQPTGQLVLIDFGTVRKVTGTYLFKLGADTEVTCVWSPGYTPEEAINGKALPQSDFYSLGRTFVHLLTGKPPLELPKESEQLNWRESVPQISASFADWIDYLMAPSPLERPPNTGFILKLLEEKNVKNLPSPPSSSLHSQLNESSLSLASRWLIILNFLLFSILLVTGMLWFQKYQQTNGMFRLKGVIQQK